MNRIQNTVDTSGLDDIFNITPNNLQSQISAVEKLIALGRFQEAEQLCDQLIARFPNNPAGFINLALIALKQLHYEIALERCDQFLQRFPNNLPLQNFKAESLISLERFNEAEELCMALCKLFPTKPNGFIGLARISSKKQDFKLTLERCEQFITCFPNAQSLLHLKSEALINLERLEEAEQVCRLLIQYFPDKPPGYVGLTRIAWRHQDFNLTLERCEQYIPYFPNALFLLHLKSEALINLDQLKEAEQVCQLLTKKFPDKPLGYVGLIKIYIKNQDVELALERCEQFIPKFPNEQSLLHMKSEALINLERLEEAEQVCRLLIQYFPDKPLGYVGLIKIYIKNQDFELALASCEQFIPKFPNEQSLLQFKAEVFLALSFFNEAERIGIYLTNSFPAKPIGNLLLARISFQQGDYQKTVERCQNLLELFPTEIHVSQLLANCLMALFRFEEAREIFHHIACSLPEKPNGYLGIARIAAAQSQHEETLNLCDRIIELFPKNIEAISLKGNTLLALSRLKEAQILFEKSIYDFPHLINGYVGLHQLYRKIEKHHSALDAILTAYRINPRNIGVITQYVTLLELMGKTEEAYELLEDHVNKRKHDACLVPLVNLYSKYGETSKILGLLENNNRFFSENVDLQIKVGLALRNKGNIIAAFTLFQNYLENNNISLAALKIKFRVYEQLCLLQSIIENQGLFRHHFLSFISLPKPYLFKNPLYNEIVERIKTGNFTKCESFLDQDLDENPSNMIALFTRKIVEFTKELNDISAVFSESYLDIGESPVSALKVSEILISRIKNKTPTSMIRLGDGEGNYLTYPPQYEHWQNNDIEDIQRVWWGDVKIELEDDKPIKALFAESVLNADILGIPDLVRRVRDIASFDNLANHRHNRGIEAIFHHLSVNKELLATKQKTILTSCHSHTDLEFWDLYRYILTNVSKVTAITCHPDFARVLHDRFGITTVNTILIPSEHRHSHNFNIHEENNNHYPDYFERIINELTVEKGDVFLVAAGFLGKIYCNEIKNKGGISIDIGSTADIWMGYSTRMEHEYLHPILGVNLDFDKFREKQFPGYRKAEKKDYYRSNFFCDMNIYQSGDELEAESCHERKKLLITGHPRCGSRYMSLLLKYLGFDVNHEWFGKDGICSWFYAVKDLNMPTLGSHRINPYASYATDFDYTLVYVRNPFDAIPSILLENWVERSYNFRRNHIIDQLGIDIDDYKSDLERAIASFLLWNKITQLKNPVETFKVEYCVEAVHAFLLKNQLLKEAIDLSTIDIATNANSTSSRGIVKPEIPNDGYKRIADHLRTDLIVFCEQYGYDITVSL